MLAWLNRRLERLNSRLEQRNRRKAGEVWDRYLEARGRVDELRQLRKKPDTPDNGP